MTEYQGYFLIAALFLLISTKYKDDDNCLYVIFTITGCSWMISGLIHLFFKITI